MRLVLSILRKLILGLLLLGLLGGAGWGAWVYTKGGNEAVKFRTEKVQRGRVALLINASGTVVPEEVVDVGAQVAGKIESFGKDIDISNKNIDYGSRVEKGTLLAVIDKSLYRADKESAEADVATMDADLEVAKADVAKAEADLEAAKAKAVQASKDFERGRRSGSSGGVSGVELDALQAAHLTAKAGVPAAAAAVEKARKTIGRGEASKKRAEASLKRSATNLAYCDIVSPIAGVIIDRRVNIGQTVVASLNAPSLFLIAKDLKRMQVWASVTEADIGRIHVGQSVNFKVDAHQNEVFTGVVEQIRLNAMSTQNVVTYVVVVRTDNSNLKLLPYLTANLQFHVAHHDGVLTVPNSALRYRPTLERVDPAHRAWYQQSRKRKVASPELRPNETAAATKGVVWVQEEDGELSPIQVRLGLTDGTITEIAEVLDGELDENTVIVTGEIQTQNDANKNPFAVNLWGSRKKRE